MADAPSAATSSAALAPLRGLRMAAIGFGTGILVGGLVGGLGGRVLMRILFLANDSRKGDFTENGNRVGDITAGGTASLVIVAMFFGAFGGLAYVLVRRWLPRGTVARGLVFGALLLVLLSGGSIDAENIDFRIFGPTGLAIALFGLLPFAYGLALAWLVDRWDSYIPVSFRLRSVTVAGYVAFAGLGVFGAVRFAGTVSDLL
jgi:hypothetical protein